MQEQHKINEEETELTCILLFIIVAAKHSEKEELLIYRNWGSERIMFEEKTVYYIIISFVYKWFAFREKNEILWKKFI